MVKLWSSSLLLWTEVSKTYWIHFVLNNFVQIIQHDNLDMQGVWSRRYRTCDNVSSWWRIYRSQLGLFGFRTQVQVPHACAHLPQYLYHLVCPCHLHHIAVLVIDIMLQRLRFPATQLLQDSKLDTTCPIHTAGCVWFNHGPFCVSTATGLWLDRMQSRISDN